MCRKIRMAPVYALIVATALTGGWTLAGAEAAPIQTRDESLRTILDGVFTATQAERGRSAYETHCSSCHSVDLQGMNGTALRGPQFIDTWREGRVSRLFNYIQTEMPPRAEGELSEQTYIDIVTFILSTNTYPAGPEELTASQLDSIQFVGENGPAPVPKFALVHVIGCLTNDADQGWMLTNVSDPIRTDNPEEVTDEELQAAQDSRLGTGTYRLVYIDFLRPGFLPESHVGHKLHAKGYLLMNDKGDGLSVTRLESLATSCDLRAGGRDADSTAQF